MVKFDGRIFMLGCGGVAQCALPVLLKQIDLDPKKITVMDFVDNRDRIADCLAQGVQYVDRRLTIDNYEEILSTYLSKGDLFIDLAWNVETTTMIDWCHKHEVLFLNTSVEVWDPYLNAEQKCPTELTLYHRQMELRRLAKKWGRSNGPTAILDHGANPGLVSHFAKQALIDIGRRIIVKDPSAPRAKQIEAAIKEKEFGMLSYMLGVKTIHISERDTQITDRPKDVNEFVNTWSIEGLVEEGMAPAEMGWGTHEFLIPKDAIHHKEGPKNQICLSSKGMKTWVRSWVPSGEITGMVIRHGESFGLSDFLTVNKEDGSALYRPTVHYAYCPCDNAINSLHEIEMRSYDMQPKLRILSDEIIKGHDELGCLLMGHDLGCWWIGTVLTIDEARELVPGQNATTVQVAGGVLSAAVYAIRHPNEGLCLPENLNHEEIIETAKPYLGNYISMPVDWNPLDNVAPYLEYNQKAPTEEEMWQFATFLTTRKEMDRISPIQ